MTSLDVRDMLDLPSAGGPPPAKKQNTFRPKGTAPRGLAREVIGLGGDNPVAIVPSIPLFKKRRAANKKPATKWALKPFKNSARGDDLHLRHWRSERAVPATEGVAGPDVEMFPEAEAEDSAFAKFNVHVNIPEYNDEQYEANLKNEDWTKEETDYLMEIVKDFDLRWPLIWDRYDWAPHMPRQPEEGEGWLVAPDPQARTMEDLKARYYFVAATIGSLHIPKHNMNPHEFHIHTLMTDFNPAQERQRKQFAEATMARSPEDRKEEENLLIELKRILARSEKLNEEKKELYARLDAPVSSTGIGIYTSSAGLQNLLQQLMTASKSKQRRSLLAGEGGAAAGGGISPVQGPNGHAPSNSLDRQNSGHRDSISGPASTKKTQAPEHRKLTDDECRTYGVTYPTERLTSGPIFRHEKTTTRFFSTKPAALQAKLAAVLNQLDLPDKRVIMPTARVTLQYERLLQSVLNLLELRKVGDKLEDQVRVETQKKAEKERKARIARGEPADPTPAMETAASGSSEQAGVEQNGDGDGEGEASKEDADGDVDIDADADADADGDGDGDGEGEEDGDAEADADAEEEPEIKSEREGSTAASSAAGLGTRGGSVHKRSASVMSQVSDKSSKRQKK